MPGLFDDLLVLDCASFIAGPAAGTIMSDFGARVIKIEPPGEGDSYRRLMSVPGMPPAPHDYFWTLDNRNKESLALDLKHPDARPVLEALIRKADVFITNFPGPIRDRLRLRDTDVLPLNDRLIYASLTPYGEDGDEKDRTGYDATAYWARSGLMDSVRASPETEPAVSVPGMGDHPTAVALFGAIMAALYRREKTGKGGAVSTSLLANGLWSNGCWMQAVLCDADFSVRLRRGQRGALTELYKARCGRWFMLVMLNHTREWPLLVEAIGKPEWLTIPALRRRTRAKRIRPSWSRRWKMCSSRATGRSGGRHSRHPASRSAPSRGRPIISIARRSRRTACCRRSQARACALWRAPSFSTAKPSVSRDWRRPSANIRGAFWPVSASMPPPLTRSLRAGRRHKGLRRTGVTMAPRQGIKEYPRNNAMLRRKSRWQGIFKIARRPL